MGYWFYQLSQQRWPPERFRIEVWEDERWSWTVGRAVLKGEEPKPGDSVGSSTQELEEMIRASLAGQSSLNGTRITTVTGMFPSGPWLRPTI
jgi:hypothetical protein